MCSTILRKLGNATKSVSVRQTFRKTSRSNFSYTAGEFSTIITKWARKKHQALRLLNTGLMKLARQMCWVGRLLYDAQSTAETTQSLSSTSWPISRCYSVIRADKLRNTGYAWRPTKIISVYFTITFLERNRHVSLLRGNKGTEYVKQHRVFRRVGSKMEEASYHPQRTF